VVEFSIGFTTPFNKQTITKTLGYEEISSATREAVTEKVRAANIFKANAIFLRAEFPSTTGGIRKGM
jgi:hypothetical protein